MVLDHVARGTNAVVVPSTAADSDVFCHRDLHMVHVLVVPNWFEHRVCESNGQQVLNSLFSEVMVDTEHGTGREHIVDDPVEFLGTLEIVAERLLNDHSPPGTSFVCGQARRPQLSITVGKKPGDRQIERMVAVGATDSVEVTEDFREFRVGFIGIKIAYHETHAAGKLFPDVLAEWCAGVFPDGVFSDLGEVLISPVPAGEADEGKRRG